MDQDMAIRVLKKIASRTSGTSLKMSRLKLSKSQIFVLAHKTFDIPLMGGGNATIDRYAIFVSLEKNVKTHKYLNWAIEFGSTWARGLAPDPSGGAVSHALDGLGAAETAVANRPSAVHGSLSGAYNTGLKSVRPVSETNPNQFGMNNRYMHGHISAGNAGLWAILESDNNILRYRGMTSFQDYQTWSHHLMDKREALEGPSTSEYKLGFQDGYETITIDGTPVRLWDLPVGYV
jgi:hypothetical protein